MQTSTDSFTFTIGIQSYIDAASQSLGMRQNNSGNDEFDRLFNVLTNDKQRISAILDFRIVENFVSNSFLFKERLLEYNNGVLTFSYNGEINSMEDMETAADIAGFMCDIISNIGKTESYT